MSKVLVLVHDSYYNRSPVKKTEKNRAKKNPMKTNFCYWSESFDIQSEYQKGIFTLKTKLTNSLIAIRPRIEWVKKKEK